MKILVTGGAGFTGSHAVRLMCRRGWDVSCYIRKPEQARGIAELGGSYLIGDLDDKETLLAAMTGFDTLVSIASLGFGHASNLVDAAEQSGIKRAIFLSTTAIFTSLDAKSKRTRIDAERRIQESRLAWTILRPTMIYGSARDRNLSRLVRFLSLSPIVPVIGTGEYAMQPVHVEDVAMAIVLALESSATIKHAYNIAGFSPLSYNDLVAATADALGRSRWVVHVPAEIVLWWLRGFERLGVRLPLKAEQVERLNEHKTFPWADAARDFGYSPRPFSVGIREEIAAMYPC